MKRIFLFITLIFSAQYLSAAAIKESDIQSSIKEVAVYAQNAHVTRIAKFPISRGQSYYRLSRLSPYINEQSIQVIGTGDIMIHGHQYEVNYITSIESSQEIKVLISNIRDLEKQIRIKKSRLDILNEKKDLLDKNKKLNVEGATVEELAELEIYFDQKLTEISTESLDIEYELIDLEEDKNILEKQLSEYNQKEKTPSGEILIKIESEKAGNSTFEISYLVYNAGWSPAYDIKVKDIASDLKIVFKANLRNNTREDWEDVKLSFSNGNPNFGGTLPVLHPWYLDFLRYKEYKKQNRGRSTPSSAELSGEAVQEEALYDELDVKVMPTQYVEQQTTMEFVMDKPYTLVSNNESVQVSLKNYDVPSTYKYHAIPKLDKHAYLVASIQNWEKRGLLNGPANLYFENRFIGKSYVDTQQLADTFNISLGQDKSLVVKRELIEIYNKKNLVGTSKIDQRGYKLTVRNTKSRDVTIIIHDQVPVSTNSQIEVKVLDIGDGVINKSTGKITWDWQIASASTQSTEYSYEVKYPKGEVVPL